MQGLSKAVPAFFGGQMKLDRAEVKDGKYLWNFRRGGVILYS